MCVQVSEQKIFCLVEKLDLAGGVAGLAGPGSDTGLLERDPHSDTAAGDGYQGYDVGANLTLAKNIVFNVKYADMESREGSEDTQTLWTDVTFTF